MSKDFLVELGTEELPPKSLLTLATDFRNNVEQALQKEKLGFKAVSYYATPRRLAVAVDALEEQAPDENTELWGPPLSVAFDKEGKPTKAAEAFASKNGLNVDDLKTKHSDEKVGKLVHRSVSRGAKAVDLLPAVVQKALDDLPIARRMRWGASRAEFVRPVHWLVMLYGTDVVNCEIYGVKSSNLSKGHRFHANHDIPIQDRVSYQQTLTREGKIMPDFAGRQKAIAEQVNAKAKELGGQAVISDDLLDEVTALVEWPVALAGNFDREFLEVPAEALISSMKEHQKYFHVVDTDSKLMPHFITVSNLESKNPAQVIDGNERVIRPRLADAAFFFNTDRQTKLEARREKLKSVLFQAKLGTIFDKTARIEALSQQIAAKIGANTDLTSRAAQLSKCDLVSSMVYEFPDMQGIAGYHYATHDGEAPEVAQALIEQYRPRFAGDDVPESLTGALIAIADRLDTITGIFGIGQTPTGSKDPFGLRRASLGVLRIMVEKKLDLDLRELVTFAAGQFRNLPKATTVADDVLAYMLERFKAWYGEAGIAPEVFQAVSAKNLSCPLDIDNRVHAVAEFYKLPEAEALASANKRVSNIIAKQDSKIPDQVNDSLLQEDAEKKLAGQVAAMRENVAPLFAQRNYTQALATLASLRAPVDNFFDNVMVMTDDEKLRNNRLALLQQLRELFLEVADISHLAVKT